MGLFSGIVAGIWFILWMFGVLVGMGIGALVVVIILVLVAACWDWWFGDPPEL